MRETTRVLLVANEFASAYAVREATRRSAVHIEMTQTASREEFIHRLRSRPPDLILTRREALPSLPFAELVEQARRVYPQVPVLVIGEEGSAATDIPPGAADMVPAEQLDRLPSAIQGALCGENSNLTQKQMRRDLERAANVMRSNQKLITMGRLAASIAHEINNPLEAVTNLLFLLRYESAAMSESGRSYLALAEHELGRVVQISKQTLNFYRETPNPVRVNPAELFEEVLVLYQRKLEEKQIDIIRQYRADDALVVFPGEMRQVFSNLVTNAIEACAPGGRLVLRIRRARQWSDQGITGLRLIVADTGSGIAAASRQHLGQLFFTTKGQRGTGLGLWVTNSIVQRYGGYIQIYSSTRPERHGSVFSIFMPTNMRPQAVKNGGLEENETSFGGCKSGTGTHGARFHPDEGIAGEHEQTSRDYRRKAERRAFGT